MFRTLKKDIAAVQERDPAARGVLEVFLIYPGFHALQMYRIAHFLYQKKFYFFAKFINYVVRFLTGIEIHPAAKIGAGVFIDHGMGVVIGETAVVKEDVTLYQGVVLGGTGKERGKRHPTIEEGVVVASGAKVLGSFTVGKNSRIGAGAVVLRSVPENSTVVGVPGRVVVQNGQKVDSLAHHQLSDPMDKYLRCLQEQILSLQDKVEAMEEQLEGKDENFRKQRHEKGCNKIKIS